MVRLSVCLGMVQPHPALWGWLPCLHREALTWSAECVPRNGTGAAERAQLFEGADKELMLHEAGRWVGLLSAPKAQ